MFVIIAPIQIKGGDKDRFIEEIIGDARGSVNDEPGCLQFNVIQGANDPNRIRLYEIYVDEAAFKAHTQAPTSSNGATSPPTGLRTLTCRALACRAPSTSGRRMTSESDLGLVAT